MEMKSARGEKKKSKGDYGRAVKSGQNYYDFDVINHSEEKSWCGVCGVRSKEK
jgi:hypothetical protein